MRCLNTMMYSSWIQGHFTVSTCVILHQVSSVIASVEDTLGLPSPHELAKDEEEEKSEQANEETSRLAAGEGRGRGGYERRGREGRESGRREGGKERERGRW